MLNWYFIVVLALAAVAGFFYLDNFLLATTRRFRKQLSAVVLHFFRVFSYTPFVILVFFVVPAIFTFIFIDFYSVAALTLTCFFATGLAFVGKYIFRRVRPLNHTTYLGKIDSAFPSAHTAGTFAAAFTLSIFWPSWSAFVFVCASLVALSRIYLELHFFSDVVGGILLAYFMTVLTLDSSLLTFLGL